MTKKETSQYRYSTLSVLEDLERKKKDMIACISVLQGYEMMKDFPYHGDDLRGIIEYLRIQYTTVCGIIDDIKGKIE